uniref:Myeloid leukemia factor 1 n=1 Tax=Xiphophorus couchianus TaxID=32473 RepID=A0A3B5LM10_9TELE
RMPPGRLPGEVFRARPTGRRPRGRPRTRWRDYVSRCLMLHSVLVFVCFFVFFLEDVSPDANAHSYRSSSVMSYSKVGDEPPKVFQATTSTRCAPGGIKETRQAFKDSDSGLEKMKIGHQIKDRRHVVEKRHNKQTGEEEIKQDFVNMDESEANSFDDEWQRKVSRLLSPDPMPGPTQRQLGSPEHPRRSVLTRHLSAGYTAEKCRKKHTILIYQSQYYIWYKIIT